MAIVKYYGENIKKEKKKVDLLYSGWKRSSRNFLNWSEFYLFSIPSLEGRFLTVAHFLCTCSKSPATSSSTTSTSSCFLRYPRAPPVALPPYWLLQFSSTLYYVIQQKLTHILRFYYYSTNKKNEKETHLDIRNDWRERQYTFCLALWN